MTENSPEPLVHASQVAQPVSSVLVFPQMNTAGTAQTLVCTAARRRRYIRVAMGACLCCQPRLFDGAPRAYVFRPQNHHSPTTGRPRACGSRPHKLQKIPTTLTLVLSSDHRRPHRRCINTQGCAIRYPQRTAQRGVVPQTKKKSKGQ